MQFADEHETSYAFLDYRLCVLNESCIFYTRSNKCLYCKKMWIFYYTEVKHIFKYFVDSQQECSAFYRTRYACRHNHCTSKYNHSKSHTLFWSNKELPPFYSSAQ